MGAQLNIAVNKMTNEDHSTDRSQHVTVVTKVFDHTCRPHLFAHKTTALEVETVVTGIATVLLSMIQRISRVFIKLKSVLYWRY